MFNGYVIINRIVIFDEEGMLKLGRLHVNPIEGKVDKDMNIAPMEIDVGNTSTKLPVEVEPAEPSEEKTSSIGTQNEEHLQTYSLAKDRERREIHPLV